MINIIVSEDCNACGICSKECPTNVLEIVGQRSSPAHIEDCMACKLCEVVCPIHGIDIVEN
jgi:ferredoxin-type protein NapF